MTPIIKISLIFLSFIVILLIFYFVYNYLNFLQVNEMQIGGNQDLLKTQLPQTINKFMGPKGQPSINGPTGPPPTE
jgi:uncharacterized membrane protein YukC